MARQPPLNRPLLTDIALVLTLSSVATLAVAWPVIESPRTTILGREIAGRHYDPFTVMQQFSIGHVPGPYEQPLTDRPGMWLARAMGGIPAYNVLVLLSFPLSALAAYLLGRYLWRSHVAALVGALAFAFAPIHIAHATYHVHVAQTQWIPLYLLALFRTIDRPTFWRTTVLLSAAAALVLSNDYGALIGAIATPVALTAYWFAQRVESGWRGLLTPLLSLGAAALAGLLAVRWAFPELTTRPELFAFPVADLIRYGARWWAYWLPPVSHPLFGQASREFLRAAGLTPGTVELQLSLSWSLTGLAVAAVVAALRSHARTGVERAVIALSILAAWSLVASLAPPASGCSSYSIQPTCLLHGVAPMFRSYARVGIVTSLCVSLLAGYAVATLVERAPISVNRSGHLPSSLAARWGVAFFLLAATVFEWWPFPGTRDVLPTNAHRFLAEREDQMRILDCVDWTLADANLPWLMGKGISLIERPVQACDEPQIASKLSALGFTHLIVRTPGSLPWNGPSTPEGLQMVTTFPDSRLYRVSADPAAVIIVDVRGFSDWERNATDRWRWMGQEGAWTVFNRQSLPVTAVLTLELQSFAAPRQVVIEIDGRPVSNVQIPVSRGTFVVNAISLSPGTHTVRFLSRDAGVRPGDVTVSSDRRPLTVGFFDWKWETAAP